MNLARCLCDDGPFPNEAFSLCKEDACEDCPVNIASAGPKYPECVIYNSEDVFTNQDFDKESGLVDIPVHLHRVKVARADSCLLSRQYEAYIDVHLPEWSNYQIIINSPAVTSFPGCGAALHTIKTNQCAKIRLKDSFMVQWCNDHDECVQAGASTRSTKWGQDFTMEAAGSGMLSMKMIGRNGTIIPPKEVGPPPLSWSVSFTTSFNFGFADVVSLGLSFDMTETTEDSTSRIFHVEDGEEGDVAFTGYLRCSKGTGHCNGKDVHGEVCTPYKNNDGNLEGLYHVVGRC
ncbi:hypothetical protein PG994_006975 [Apiospora phragmitis]|uniref:Uncharacterized protein n=1 Tax=Apiospora phragmitis TaxID=2905665 RepID=A0ABR1UZI5_9PEZI